MGWIEELDRSTGTRFRAVPWHAGPPGVRGKRGRSKVYGPGERHLAEKYITAEEKRDAREWAEAGLPVVRATPARRVRFAEYLVEVTATLGEEWATRQSNASIARKVAEVWPTEYLDEITAADLRTYLAGLLDLPISTALRARRRMVLVATFRAAVRDGHLSTDPTVDLKSFKIRKGGTGRPITEAELATIIKAVPGWLRAGVWLSYDSGLRIGEVFGLPWYNVDLDGGGVTVGPVMQQNGAIKPYPKNGHVERVVASDRALAALRHHAEKYPGRPTDLVIRRHDRFRTGRGGFGPEPLSTNAACKVWKRACIAAGIDEPLPRWHDLRHHTAHALVESGTPVHVLKAMMRHHDIASTAVYLPDVTPAQMREALRRASRPDGDDGAAGVPVAV